MKLSRGFAIHLRLSDKNTLAYCLSFLFLFSKFWNLCQRANESDNCFSVSLWANDEQFVAELQSCGALREYKLAIAHDTREYEVSFEELMYLINGVTSKL